MRVAMICPYSLTVPGGVQGQVFGLSAALRQAGHSVEIIGPADGPPPAPGVTVVGPSVFNASNGSMAPISPEPATQLRTIRLLREEQFDVVHLHEPLVPGPTVTALLMHTAPAVGTFHAAGDQPAYKSMSGLARRFAARLDAKVAVSNSAMELARVAIPDPWTVLYNGVDVDQFALAEPWADDDTESGRPIVLFVGRHEERKGLSVLLAAVERLPEDLIVWIAGSGPETEALQAQYSADARLRWLGRVSNEERNSRMAAASVFCAPSLGGESFGVILLEAMAAGTPVIASAIEGYVGVARGDDGQAPAALFHPAGDAVELAAQLRRVIGDPALRESLNEAGARRCREYSMDRLATAYEMIYEAIQPQPKQRWRGGLS